MSDRRHQFRVIARHFASIGLNLFYKTTVGDNLGRLIATFHQTFGGSDVALTTGGPTADGMTRGVVAATTDRELVFSGELMRLDLIRRSLPAGR